MFYLYYVTNALVYWPFLAAFPAAIFFMPYRRSRARMVLVAALAWLTYCLYESAMRARWFCSGECNIRVDLLLIFPLLAILSVIAIVILFRGRREPRA